MVRHVEVAVEVADAGAEDERGQGGEQQGCVVEWGDHGGQLVVVGTGFGLLGAGVDGQHDRVELVQRGVAHGVADVWEGLPGAHEFTRHASSVTTDSCQGHHHDHCCLNCCC